MPLRRVVGRFGGDGAPGWGPARASHERGSLPIDTAYNAAHLLVLEGLEAVRKRPGMYIGSTDSRGLVHCLWEIIDNAFDEALAGFCDRVDVILHADGSAEVHDNGRGLKPDHKLGLGLTGMRERIVALGGTLTVASSDAGVRVEAIVPIGRRAIG